MHLCQQRRSQCVRCRGRSGSARRGVERSDAREGTVVHNSVSATRATQPDERSHNSTAMTDSSVECQRTLQNAHHDQQHSAGTPHPGQPNAMEQQW